MVKNITKIDIKNKLPFSAMWIQGSSMMFLRKNRNFSHYKVKHNALNISSNV